MARRYGSGVLTAVATTAAAGGVCSARVGDQIVTVRVAIGLAVAVNDTILITRQGSHWWAIVRLFAGTAEQPNDSAPAPAPAAVAGTLVVPPVYTGTFRSGAWFAGSVDQGRALGSAADNTGAAFYGTKARALAGALVTSAIVRVRRTKHAGSFGAAAATLRLVTEATKPTGAPTLGSSTPGPSLAMLATTDFPVPPAWVQSMVAGTAGGLAVFDADGDPYLRFAGTDTYPPAWTLTITWSR